MHPVEALERLGVAVLFLAHLAEVEQRKQEIRSDLDRALEQALRLVVAVGGLCHGREQPERIDVARVVAQHAPIQLLGLLETAIPVMLGRERHQPPLGRAVEAALERDVGVLARPSFA